MGLGSRRDPISARQGLAPQSRVVTPWTPLRFPAEGGDSTQVPVRGGGEAAAVWPAWLLARRWGRALRGAGSRLQQDEGCCRPPHARDHPPRPPGPPQHWSCICPLASGANPRLAMGPSYQWDDRGPDGNEAPPAPQASPSAGGGWWALCPPPRLGPQEDNAASLG